MSRINTVIATGDISDGWNVSVRDSNKEPMNIDPFSCHIAVVDDEDQIVVPVREIEQAEGNSDFFLAYLTDEETATLTPGKVYRLIIQVANLSLPKPIKKEIEEPFEMKKGFID